MSLLGIPAFFYMELHVLIATSAQQIGGVVKRRIDLPVLDAAARRERG